VSNTEAPAPEVVSTATAFSEEIFPDGTVPITAQDVGEENLPDPAVAAQKETDPLAFLHGSSKLGETIEIKGNVVTAHDVVKYAFACSKLKVEEWNKLSNPKREAFIMAALDSLRKELKPVPKNNDGKPKLTLQEKQRIKDNKFAKEVAGQQWAGLAALKGHIQFKTEEKPQKKFGKVKLHNSKK
jgi:hypothetical protein